MASLKPGEVVLVNKLDRLGRSTREPLELIELIGEAGAACSSLGDPVFDVGVAVVECRVSHAEISRALDQTRGQEDQTISSRVAGTEKPAGR